MTRYVPVLVCLSAVLAVLCLAGALDPPPGPPGSPESEMKSLNEIEPRNIVDSLPFVISNSGSYYVSMPLEGKTNDHGITIIADDVTLDLNGFSIVGSTNADWYEPAPDTTYIGVNIPNIQGNITIRNGAIRHWGQQGVRGILAKNSRIENVIVANCGSTNGYPGIDVGVKWVMVDCVAMKNSGDGITAGGASVRRTEARDNGRHGINIGGGRVEDCSVRGNTHDGIRAADGTVVRNCIAESNSTNGINVVGGCLVVGNSVSWSAVGILAENACRIDGNHLTQNSYGIRTISGDYKNFVIRNSVVGVTPANNYDFQDAAHAGQVLSSGDLGTNFMHTNPWANFSL